MLGFHLAQRPLVPTWTMATRLSESRVDHRGEPLPEGVYALVNASGAYVAGDVKRSDLDLPDFHALRHGAAMACDDAEEARDLLRHRNSNVTRSIYRAHFDDRRRANLRARMEARMEATDGAKSTTTPARAGGEVADLQRFRTPEG